MYVRPTQHLVLRWQTPSAATKYSTVVCSILDWSPGAIIACYDDRGGCETEIQADKTALRLERRRKKHLAAQKALIILTDIAHNLLAWTSHWMFSAEPLSGFGPLRLTEDMLSLPGRLFFDQGQLVEVHLNQLHPHAAQVAVGLERLLDHFGYP